jgi:hypothetical protein
LNFKHLIFKYKLGFVSQLEGFTLSKKVFRHIITDGKKRHNLSSYVCDMNNIVDFLQINLSDFGNKSVFNNQLDIFYFLFFLLFVLKISFLIFNLNFLFFIYMSLQRLNKACKSLINLLRPAKA